MAISARVLARSTHKDGVPLTTLEITAHRWILAEINTHRVLSRNFRSSRAVPVAKLIQEVSDNPAMPVRWRKNQRGMVGGEDFTPEEQAHAERIWKEAAFQAADQAQALMALGLEKGAANRILEPFLYVHGIITSTDWDNFFSLRLAPDAQPEFQALAQVMKPAVYETPVVDLTGSGYHLPYVTQIEADTHDFETLGLLSAARCARVSFIGHDGRTKSVAEEIEFAKTLMKNRHWSPFEHQAEPDALLSEDEWEYPEQHRNFRTWRQFRAMIGG